MYTHKNGGHMEIDSSGYIFIFILYSPQQQQQKHMQTTFVTDLFVFVETDQDIKNVARRKEN